MTEKEVWLLFAIEEAKALLIVRIISIINYELAKATDLIVFFPGHHVRFQGRRGCGGQLNMRLRCGEVTRIVEEWGGQVEDAEGRGSGLGWSTDET